MTKKPIKSDIKHRNYNIIDCISFIKSVHRIITKEGLNNCDIELLLTIYTLKRTNKTTFRNILDQYRLYTLDNSLKVLEKRKLIEYTSYHRLFYYTVTKEGSLLCKSISYYYNYYKNYISSLQ